MVSALSKSGLKSRDFRDFFVLSGS